MATRRRPAPTPALDVLRDDEYATVLRNLLDAHPELRAEAEQTARHLLEAASVEALADDVSWALGELPLEDLAARSGPIRGRGYVFGNEAAWELVSEAVEPLIADLRRRAGLGLADAAAVVATGIVAGLYQAERRRTAPLSPTPARTRSANSPTRSSTRRRSSASGCRPTQPRTTGRSGARSADDGVRRSRAQYTEALRSGGSRS